jgi:hypothetical protein
MNSRYERPVCGSEGFGEVMAKCTGRGVLVPRDGIRPVALPRLLDIAVKEQVYDREPRPKGRKLPAPVDHDADADLIPDRLSPRVDTEGR